MPRRPRSHQIETLSINRLRDVFSNIGWVVEEISQDYGEDVLVRIFEDGLSTPWAFYIQAKATDDIGRYTKKDGKTISYPIKTGHLNHWMRFWEPVILTLWDSEADVTYWECIQTYLEDIKWQRDQKVPKTLSVAIPTDNVLDGEGLRRILLRTKSRMSRFEREKEGAEHLMQILKEQWQIEIMYDPQVGVLMLPKGL